ncbi:hypothetical protein F4811DRAFT_476775 [Daldinia bambusicola]|nr:hypothetical protein F4811DRAFT_476775 [Daldinia bambusicola]
MAHCVFRVFCHDTLLVSISSRLLRCLKYFGVSRNSDHEVHMVGVHFETEAMIGHGIFGFSAHQQHAAIYAVNSRRIFTNSARLAQSVERETLNLKVAGSTPASGSIPDASQLTGISNHITFFVYFLLLWHHCILSYFIFVFFFAWPFSCVYFCFDQATPRQTSFYVHHAFFAPTFIYYGACGFYG